MSRYGLVYRTADYLGRCLPARTEQEKGLLAHKAVYLLKALDNAQERNASITLTVWASDGIWVSHNGYRLFLVLPRTSGFRVLYGMSSRNRSFDLHNKLMKAKKAGRKIEDVRRQSDYHLWSIGPNDLDIIVNFISELPVLEKETTDDRHPRYFSGAVRQLALEMFERDGRRCPGTKNRPRHKVDTTKERIEFDHILPDALGGSRSALNVQVLCEACNRAKRATAL